MQGCASGEGSERVGGRARAGSGTDPQSTCAMSKTSLPVLPERSPAELPLPVLFPAGDASPYSPYTGGEQTQSGSHSVPAQHIPTRGSKWSWWDHSGSSHLCGALSPGPLTCMHYCSPTQLDRAIPMLSAPAGLCQRSLHGGDSRSVLPPSSSPWTGSALTPALGLLQPGGYNLKHRGGKSCAGLRGEAGDRRACSCSPLPPNNAHWSSTGLGPGNGTMYRQHQCFGGPQVLCGAQALYRQWGGCCGWQEFAALRC